MPKTKPASKSKYTKRPLPNRPAHRSQVAPVPEPVKTITSTPNERIFKLGTMVVDTATDALGMLTHMQVEMGGARFYRFQPRGLNPENGEPIKAIWLVPARIAKGELVELPEMPLQLLGTQAEDQATGFKGMVVSVTLHLSGCCHAMLQPKGTLAKTGAAVENHDFDVRRLISPLLKPLSEAEREADQKSKPSPIETDRYTPRDQVL